MSLCILVLKTIQELMSKYFDESNTFGFVADLIHCYGARVFHPPFLLQIFFFFLLILVILVLYCHIFRHIIKIFNGLFSWYC